MKKLAILLAATAAFGGQAVAADLPVKARVAAPVVVYDWSGIYVGTSLGGEWGNIQHNHYSETVAPGPFILNPSYSRATIGAQAGVQYMFSSGIILGVEAAYSQAFDKITASQLCPPPITINTRCDQAANGLYTAGGRLGYAVQGWTMRVMVYGWGRY